MGKFVTKSGKEVEIRKIVPEDFEKIQEYIDYFLERNYFYKSV